MGQFTVHYKFSQRFQFSAKQVYEWSTDFRSEDIILSGREGTREIERLDDSTLLLTDTLTHGAKPDTKVRLIRLFPEILMYTNTRVSEVGKHSQFIYQIVPEGAKASRLDFTGAQVDEAGRLPSKSELEAMAQKYMEEDALIWVNLAAAMEKDLDPKRSRGTSRNRAR